MLNSSVTGGHRGKKEDIIILQMQFIIVYKPSKEHSNDKTKRSPSKFVFILKLLDMEFPCGNVVEGFLVIIQL